MKKNKNAISPSRNEDFAAWYQQVIKNADLAEHSCVKGCMIIKPWGYAIWENIQKILDKEIKKTGHQNVYFPLFIPLSFFEKEAKHVEGFAKECAVVTHCRLKNENGSLVPDSKLEEPLIVRPTSEMLIGDSFSKWIQSYRDLPVLINQWANVVRWEMRTRLFLRSTEFLWQEGHTAHATKQEALDETVKMLNVYKDFVTDHLAIYPLCGEKTQQEKFPGADITFALEAMMQDKKALQLGTSHFLGQNFAISNNIKFKDKDEQDRFAWTTSWGITTRLIGAIIMTHSDDNGLVLPPNISPYQVVILPIIHNEDDKKDVLTYCRDIKDKLNVEVFIDDKDIRGGQKKWQWIKKGVPILLEIGKRDIEKDMVTVINRLDCFNKKCESKLNFIKTIEEQLNAMQNELLTRSKNLTISNIKQVTSKEEVLSYFSSDKEGFLAIPWDDNNDIEKEITKKLPISVRCLIQKEETNLFKEKNVKQVAIIAKAY